MSVEANERESLRRRKEEHLDICLAQNVEYAGSSWLEHVQLIHNALSEVSIGSVDTSMAFLGRALAAPFIIGAMTGGTERADRINKQLAEAAGRCGVGLALGSQRWMLEGNGGPLRGIRALAPEAVLIGNIGVNELVSHGVSAIVRMYEATGVDGLCVHLNHAMEIVQPEGTDVSGSVCDRIRELAALLGERLIVKETGCGISYEVALKLVSQGVRCVDVSGSGGTNWIRVEAERQESGRSVVDAFREWGLPTALCLYDLAPLPVVRIASGGLRSGLDMAKAIAMGADMTSAALPVLKAVAMSGVNGVCEWIAGAVGQLRMAMALLGCADIKALQSVRVWFRGPLLEYVLQRRYNQACCSQISRE